MEESIQTKEKVKSSKKSKVIAESPQEKEGSEPMREEGKEDAIAEIKEVKNEKAVVEEDESEMPEADVSFAETEEEIPGAPSRYYESVGRRKRAVARVRLFTKGEKKFFVNSKPYTDYFRTEELQFMADGAVRKMKVMDKFMVSAMVLGGGVSSQAEAVRQGTARALVKFNVDFRKRLKRAGYLKRDPREVERKKFGLKKARRAPQWAKR